jgi:hypothetical protein
MDAAENPQSRPHHILSFSAWFYVAVCWAQLVGQIQPIATIWKDAATIRDAALQGAAVCGNPLMSSWAGWFVMYSLVGIWMLPGFIWAIGHPKNRIGIMLLVGFLLYLLGLSFMLLSGIWLGTVPIFFYFIPEVFKLSFMMGS